MGRVCIFEDRPFTFSTFSDHLSKARSNFKYRSIEGKKQVPEHDVSGPEERDDVERQQLSRLVELVLLGLGQMQPLAEFLRQKIKSD